MTADLAAVTAYRLIPVVVIHDAARAEGLAQALVTGGLPVAEVTFRTAAAEASIRVMAAHSDLLVGAGTVVNPDQVDRAVDAGARFIVSPGLSGAVVERCRQQGVPVVPGCVTPTEVMAALSSGLTTLKFFPAAQFGGPAAIKALSGPFPQVSFIPTGGVTPVNLGEYLSLGCVPAVGGSWMVPASALEAGDFSGISQLCRAAVDAAHDR